MANENWLKQFETRGGRIGDMRDRQAVLHFGDANEEYRALKEACGMVDLSHRAQILASGKDRAKFLHNLCTNDIVNLKTGAACEAFFLNAQGKILFHGFIAAGEEAHLIESIAGISEKLFQHLDRYILREEVTLVDRSGDWGAIYLGGPRMMECLARTVSSLPATISAATATEPYYVETVWGEEPIAIRRSDFLSVPGTMLYCRRSIFAKAWEAFIAAGVVPCGELAFETARIEAGTPFYGQDISDDNLPQEVARDSLTISFKKGCYLGQETVARLDALGHVNKMLTRLRFAATAAPPPSGTEIFLGQKLVGKVTSSATNLSGIGSLALAYIRREALTPGAILTSAMGRVEVSPSGPLKS